MVDRIANVTYTNCEIDLHRVPERRSTMTLSRQGSLAMFVSILMCAVAQREVFMLKEIVTSCDNDAFVIISNTEEILGNYKSEFVKIN